MIEDDMPSTSPAQARLMAMVAHDADAAKRTGVPQKVAKEFNKADAKTGILRKKKKAAPAAPTTTGGNGNGY